MSDSSDRSQESSSTPSFLRELKSRRVPRVTIVYLAAGFAVVEAADIMLPRLGLADWTVTLVVALVLLGLPLAVGISWAFDWTPEGLVRAPAHSPDTLESPGDTADRSRVGWVGPKTLLATGLFLALGVGMTGGWFIRPTMDEGATAERPTKIAILPFRNASVGDAENASLAFGIHDDLLTRISRIQELRVISRTSVTEYADSEKSIPEIARELGADVVIEGGVQRAGSNVRITVQLIDGRTDEHLWADRYDRPFDIEQLFRTQSEIAERVAVELQATLSPQESAAISKVPTTDSLALRLYRDAWPAYDDIVNQQAIRTAIAWLEQALERDPAFAEAWALLSIFQADMKFFEHDPTEERVVAAFTAAARALDLDPDLPLAHVALGNAHYHGRSDYDPAIRAFRRALELDPSSAPAHLGLGAVLRRQGRMASALVVLEEGLEFDPRSINLLTTVAHTRTALRDWEGAEALLSSVLTIDRTRASSWIFDVINRSFSFDTPSAAEVDEALGRIEELGGERLRAEIEGGIVLMRGDRDGFEEVARMLPGDYVWEGQFEWTPVELLRAQAAWMDGDESVAGSQAALAEERILDHLNRSPDDSRAWRQLGLARALRGDREGSYAASDRALELVPRGRDFLTWVNYRFGRLQQHSILGRRDEAFALMEEFVDLPAGHELSPSVLARHPLLDPLRADPRWEPTVARLLAPLD